jgi:elongation factor Ts
MVDKIVEGQISKFFAEQVLLEQVFVKNPPENSKRTVEGLLKELVAKLGENIQIRRFARYELGEGLEKKQEDFAAEVAAQVNQGSKGA